MKTFEKRPLRTTLAASLLAIGTGYAQNSSEPTGPDDIPAPVAMPRGSQRLR
ncbi:MAG TPA: hypothetical protein VFQ55_06990 [Casimicrobiaceae bacterium]|nr:hypothetical protein [Casimicrobiaceae bacterium]